MATYVPPKPQDAAAAETEVTNALAAIVELVGLLPIIAVAAFFHDEHANVEHWGRSFGAAVKTLIAGGAFLWQDVFGQLDANLYQFVTDDLKPFLTWLGTEYHTLLDDILNSQRNTLIKSKSSDPAQAQSIASSALLEASLLGVGSRLVTVGFEAVFPKSMNVFNWLGPTLAEWSGYDSIIRTVREPLYRAAIARLAEYQANADFPNRLPDEADAITWNSRGLLKPGQLEEIFKYSGLRPDYESAYTQSAFRPLSAFIVADIAKTGALTHPQVIQLLTFAGVRTEDQALVLKYADYATASTQRAAAQSSLLMAAERGMITDAEMADYFNSLEQSSDQLYLLQSAIDWRRLVQLGDLYRKSVSEGYQYGTVTDADYVADLEAIGINAADAEAHYAVDSVKKHGKDAVAQARAAAALAKQTTRANMQAAVQQFQAREIDQPELLAKLVAAGVEPAIAEAAVTVQELKRRGHLRYVFGLWLETRQATDLREQVTAIEDQYKKQLIDDAAAAAAIDALGIPPSNAAALLATWAAEKVKPTTYGEKLPR